ASEPELALMLHPGQANALLYNAEKLRLSGRPQSVENDSASALLRRAPLLDAPFLYAGLALSAKGDDKGAHALLVSAVARQPRNVPALSWLAAHAVRNSQFEEAASDLDRLWNLNPRDEALYAGVLASMAADNGAVDVLETRLLAGSRLAETALDRLNSTSRDMPLLLRLNAHSHQGINRLVARLFEEEGAAPALIAWLSLAPDLEAR